jgi:hypothetical protein
MPAVYENAGLCFEYPENWLLEAGSSVDGESPGDEDSVTVYSPGGSFWTVVRHPGGKDPKPYVEAALQAMQEEYDEIDVEAVEETVLGHRLVGCDLNFFYLDLTNTARIRGVRTPGSTLLLFCQADDRELDEIDDVFRAMTASLLSGFELSKESRWPKEGE